MKKHIVFLFAKALPGQVSKIDSSISKMSLTG